MIAYWTVHIFLLDPHERHYLCTKFSPISDSSPLLIQIGMNNQNVGLGNRDKCLKADHYFILICSFIIRSPESDCFEGDGDTGYLYFYWHCIMPPRKALDNRHTSLHIIPLFGCWRWLDWIPQQRKGKCLVSKYPLDLWFPEWNVIP